MAACGGTNDEQQQAQAIAANEGAHYKLLQRMPVMNVELWGVTVSGWKEDGTTKYIEGVWKKNTRRRQRKKAHPSRLN